MVSEALLSFSLTPVQRFIEAARTVRDLKAGSKLLSHLTWQALQAVGSADGEPMFPAVDLTGSEPESIPNLFLARFHGDSAAQRATRAAQQAEKVVRERWRAVADHVRAELGNRWGRGWDADWDEQIEGFWDITTVVLNAAEAPTVYRQMTGNDPPSGASELSTQFKAISGLLAARKMVRTFVADHGVGRYKCSMMGDLEQMGPVGLSEADAFWRGVAGTRLSPASIGAHDRLCAVSLVKRFCHCVPGVDGLSGDIPETAKVAAGKWFAQQTGNDGTRSLQAGFTDAYAALKRTIEAEGKTAETPWRCLLVDRLTPDTVAEEKWEGAAPQEVVNAVNAFARARKTLVDSAASSPPRYYGIIALDGDHMGRWLSGEMRQGAVDPEFWDGMSRRLLEYAEVVRDTVDASGGYTVYAGGDDLLALNPLETALECAAILRSEFPPFDTDKDGKPPTASAGLAIVHYQHDLRAGLHAARKAEHAAKSPDDEDIDVERRAAHQAEEVAKRAGRNALGISLVKRSGGQVDLVIEWDQVPRLMKLQRLFAAGLSDRWLYKLDEIVPDVHPDLAGEALTAIVAHSLKRIEIAREHTPGLRRELGLPEDADAEAIKQALRIHVQSQFADWLGRAAGVSALDRFIKFGMIASFLQRGRD